MLIYYYVLVDSKAKLSNVVAVFPESDIWWFFFNSRAWLEVVGNPKESLCELLCSTR